MSPPTGVPPLVSVGCGLEGPIKFRFASPQSRSLLDPLVVSFFRGIHVGRLAASSTLLPLGTNATTDFNYGTCVLAMVYWGWGWW